MVARFLGRQLLSAGYQVGVPDRVFGSDDEFDRTCGVYLVIYIDIAVAVVSIYIDQVDYPFVFALRGDQVDAAVAFDGYPRGGIEGGDYPIDKVGTL